MYCRADVHFIVFYYFELTKSLTRTTIAKVLSNTYQRADKFLTRPGRKQVRKHVRDARDFNNIETRAVIKFFFSCKARRRRKFTPF